MEHSAWLRGGGKLAPAGAEGAEDIFSRSVEVEHAAVCTLTFGRAQDVRIAETAHKGHTAKFVQRDGPRAEILHGHIPHLTGQGTDCQVTHSQGEHSQDLQLC